jgi:hypothetical protein
MRGVGLGLGEFSMGNGQVTEMLVDQETFIAKLNKWARRRGMPEISRRMIENWNEEAVFPNAFRLRVPGVQGFAWRYGITHARHAILICSLKKRGYARFALLRFALWLRGNTIVRLPPKSDLLAEFARQRNALINPITSAYDPTKAGNRDEYRVAILLRQLGTQAEVFRVPPLELSPNEMENVYAAARYGEPDEEMNLKLAELAAVLLPGANLGAASSLLHANVFSGVWGTPDEIDNSAIADLERATDSELNGALLEYRLMRRSFPSWIQSQVTDEGLRAAFHTFVEAQKDLHWQLTSFTFILLNKLRSAGVEKSAKSVIKQ